jgi:hypothetical protein
MGLRRVSDWQIIWSPSSDGERTLLATGDEMAEELVTSEVGAHQVGILDTAAAALVVARGGARRRLEISRIVEHASFNAAWKRICQEMADDMWGMTRTLQITPSGGSAREARAALLSTSHTISTEDGLIETIHRWKFRVSRNIL